MHSTNRGQAPVSGDQPVNRNAVRADLVQKCGSALPDSLYYSGLPDLFSTIVPSQCVTTNGSSIKLAWSGAW